MTMDPNIGRIWPNWCEILPKRRQEGSGDNARQIMDGGELYETYHMNPLYTALLDSEDMLKDLRRRVKNIIDWGCIKRMIEIKGVMTIIFEIEQAADQARSENGSPRNKLKVTGA